MMHVRSAIFRRARGILCLVALAPSAARFVEPSATFAGAPRPSLVTPEGYDNATPRRRPLGVSPWEKSGIPRTATRIAAPDLADFTTSVSVPPTAEPAASASPHAAAPRPPSLNDSEFLPPSVPGQTPPHDEPGRIELGSADPATPADSSSSSLSPLTDGLNEAAERALDSERRFVPVPLLASQLPPAPPSPIGGPSNSAQNGSPATPVEPGLPPHAPGIAESDPPSVDPGFGLAADEAMRSPVDPVGRADWTKQCLPPGLLYRAYIAGEKESRFAISTVHETGRGVIWEVSLGGRAGIYRNGTRGAINPDGFQIDIEGAALVRLDVEESQDVDATDYRFGIPFTHRRGPLAWKYGYYHISSHVGDEFMIKHPQFQRINYVRESLFYGVSYDVLQDVRVYGEVGYAFRTAGGAEPLEFQFGSEFSPLGLAGEKRGAPFAAVNLHLRQEFDFGGSINALAGWQWRGVETGHAFRVGLQYFNGKSIQYSFFDHSEQLVGVGMWFDY